MSSTVLVSFLPFLSSETPDCLQHINSEHQMWHAVRNIFLFCFYFKKEPSCNCVSFSLQTFDVILQEKCSCAQRVMHCSSLFDLECGQSHQILSKQNISMVQQLKNVITHYASCHCTVRNMTLGALLLDDEVQNNKIQQSLKELDKNINKYNRHNTNWTFWHWHFCKLKVMH